MRKPVFTTALFLGLLLSQTVQAQQDNQITLRVPGFVRPLFEKWVGEYKEKNPQVHFLFVSGKSQDNNQNTISITTEASPSDSQQQSILFARYAVLPVTAKGSDAEQLIASHSLNAKKLKNLFFVKDQFDDEPKETKWEKQIHIITGNSQQSASRLYAASFRQETAYYKGKKIQGDDTFLNVALSRDPLGVTVNSLSNIYDLKSRRLQQTLVVLPLDIDKEGRQIIREGRLDNLITLLERETYAEIPVGDVALSYNRTSSLLNHFAYWVLTDGVESLHQYGLLSLPKKQLATQQKLVEQQTLAQK